MLCRNGYQLHWQGMTWDPDGVARIAATPSMRPGIDSSPLFAPSNPARIHPDR
jgi:hypothetical protein